ncbi:MAG: hypothetical protein J6M44_09535 [Butyrivibrio sp.]|nr:hypothetical protein [Butyrivibrio sp.]
MNKIREAFKAFGPEYEDRYEMIEKSALTKEELTELGVDIEVTCTYDYYREDERTGVYEIIPEGIQGYSLYLHDIIEYLLSKGMDPNLFVDEENVMWELQYFTATSTGAEVLTLLLENGGNPNIRENDNSESLMEYINYKIRFELESEEQNPMGLFHLWLVLLAFGGCYSNGVLPVEMLDGNKVEIFKDYQRFEYRITEETMEIIDKTNGSIVAMI